MTRLEALFYDLRHPITAIQRTCAARYCNRFDLVLVERAAAELNLLRAEPL